MKIPSVYEQPEVEVYKYDTLGLTFEAERLGKEFAEFLWNNVPACFYNAMQERLKELNEED